MLLGAVIFIVACWDSKGGHEPKTKAADPIATKPKERTTSTQEVRAAEGQLARTQLAKLGKVATALVEVKAGPTQGLRQGYGSAFCIHRSGLFVTNEHVVYPPGPVLGHQPGARGEVTLVLNPGEKTQKSYAAQVIRTDKQLDLALVRVDGANNFPALNFGDDEQLEELMDVVAFGFPFGAGIEGGGAPPSGQPAAANRRDYPSVSVNPGSITALRRKGGDLDRIQLDATINPGNSGGPVLDKNGKVIGLVVSLAVAQGLGRTGISHAIPVSHLKRFLARPDIVFDPPKLSPANVYKPVAFEAKVVPILPSEAPLTVDLILKPDRGREQSHRMEAAGDKYRVTTVPLPPPPGPLKLRLLAQFENGLLNGTTVDRAFKVSDRQVRFSEVRSVQRKPGPRAVFNDGKTVEGPVSGLDAVPVQLGEQSLAVDLAQAEEVKLAPAVETDQVWCTLLVRQGAKEILRQTESLLVEGLLPNPNASAGPTGIKPPALEGNVAIRKLASAVDDVAVGGAGRYLVLHFPSLHKLAVFDVSAAEVVGYIPVKEDNLRFAAGLEDVVVLLPGAGTIERWSLKTLEREVVTPLPIKGVIKAVAMGSASKGPLLVHWGPVSNGAIYYGFALISMKTMKLVQLEVPIAPHMQPHLLSSQEIIHLRAAANGKVFGMWSTSHLPSGVGVIVTSDAGVRSYYGHWGSGHVLPGPDGKILFTRFGTCAPEVTLTDMPPPQGGPVLPACHGDYYLSLPAAANPGQVRPSPFPPRPGNPQPGQPPASKAGTVMVRALGKDKPIATLPDLELLAPREESIKHDFTFDKRVHLVPEARLLITIPDSNDRLVLHRFSG
jgi:S1-C subfamily serine protease